MPPQSVQDFTVLNAIWGVSERGKVLVKTSKNTWKYYKGPVFDIPPIVQQEATLYATKCSKKKQDRCQYPCFWDDGHCRKINASKKKRTQRQRPPSPAPVAVVPPAPVPRPRARRAAAAFGDTGPLHAFALGGSASARLPEALRFVANRVLRKQLYTLRTKMRNAIAVSEKKGKLDTKRIDQMAGALMSKLFNVVTELSAIQEIAEWMSDLIPERYRKLYIDIVVRYQTELFTGAPPAEGKYAHLDLPEQKEPLPPLPPPRRPPRRVIAPSLVASSGLVNPQLNVPFGGVAVPAGGGVSIAAPARPPVVVPPPTLTIPEGVSVELKQILYKLRKNMKRAIKTQLAKNELTTTQVTYMAKSLAKRISTIRSSALYHEIIEYMSEMIPEIQELPTDDYDFRVHYKKVVELKRSLYRLRKNMKKTIDRRVEEGTLNTKDIDKMAEVLSSKFFVAKAEPSLFLDYIDWMAEVVPERFREDFIEIVAGVEAEEDEEVEEEEAEILDMETIFKREWPDLRGSTDGTDYQFVFQDRLVITAQDQKQFVQLFLKYNNRDIQAANNRHPNQPAEALMTRRDAVEVFQDMLSEIEAYEAFFQRGEAAPAEILPGAGVDARAIICNVKITVEQLMDAARSLGDEYENNQLVSWEEILEHVE